MKNVVLNTNIEIKETFKMINENWQRFKEAIY